MNGVSSSSNRSKWTKESELHAPISKKDLKKLAKKAKSSPRSPQQNDKTEKPITIASKVDKHHLYMLSVQSPSLEIRNLINIYGEMSTKFRSVLPVKSLRKSKHASDTTINNNDEEEEEDLLAIPRIPLLLREDFCGTAILSREWCKTHVEREAYSTDLDTSVIAYARKQILEGGGPESDRVHVICDNVMNTEAKTDAGESAPLVDIIASLNYATFYFHRRKDLVEYLKLCRARLRKGGIMVTDMMGGSDVQLEKNMYKRELFSDQIGPFTYVCEQSGFNLLTNVINLALGFRFPDGSALKHAYKYSFRIWSIPELREAFIEAGFLDVGIYFSKIRHDPMGSDGEEEEDGGNTDGEGSEEDEELYRRVDSLGHLKQMKRWNAYLVGVV